MKASRVAALIALSIVPAIAWSQGSGSGSGSAEQPAPTDDDEGSTGSGGPALVAPPMPAARKQWVVQQIDAAIAARPTLGKAKVGIAITDLVTGEQIYQHDGDVQMNLASTTKLLTSTAALATLGNSFRWRTSVLADKAPDDKGVIDGDLYLRGRGDPLLSADALDDLAAEVAARGVKKVDGKLILDTSYFDDVTEPPHFAEQPKERSGFRAPVAALGVARSSVTVKLSAHPGGDVDMTLEPDAGDYIKLVDKGVTIEEKGRTRLRAEAKASKANGSSELEITGKFHPGDGVYELRRRIDDPARFAGEVFRTALAKHGVTFKEKKIGSGTVPQAAKGIALHDSQALPDVLRFMNKSSDNYVAESVLKTIGAETRATPGPGTWADGTSAVAAALAKLGLPTGSYRADNGSGLFDASGVTARQMVALLTAAHGNYRIGPDLVQSLPIGGADGTLAKRWRGLPAQGRVRAKTGTLDKVVTLAGFVAVEGNKVVAFSVFLNDVPAGQRSAARALADDVVNVIAAYLGAT
ncbi:MAG TPA: D-alanyl-D-alanine carboxypeptidase/D-alanyl-D-alanine-endopeptidase [Kofleriaceae bacterium]